MAGVLGNPIGSKRRIVEGENLNTIIQNGIYYCSKETAAENKPVAEYLLLLVVSMQSEIAQLAITYIQSNKRSIWMRGSGNNGGTWNAWVQFSQV